MATEVQRLVDELERYTPQELEARLGHERHGMVVRLLVGAVDGKRYTIEEVAAYFGVPRSRVVEIVREAVERLRGLQA